MTASLYIDNGGRRKLGLVLAACLLPLCLASRCLADEVYALTPDHTRPTFDVVSLGFVHTHGVFNAASGFLLLDHDHHRGTIEVIIQTASLATGSSSRDAFLKGERFFNVGIWPTVTVQAENFELNGEFPRNVDGTLIMMGVRQPITLSIASMTCTPAAGDRPPTCRSHVDTTIQRSRWGLDHFTHLVSDNVKIAVDVEATPTSVASEEECRPKTVDAQAVPPPLPAHCQRKS
ncbi:MAG: YceI family protein [Burkholderiales bacterium]|nr:YceI family protein [Burkholderiales bacterium]